MSLASFFFSHCCCFSHLEVFSMLFNLFANSMSLVSAEFLFRIAKLMSAWLFFFDDSRVLIDLLYSLFSLADACFSCSFLRTSSVSNFLDLTWHCRTDFCRIRLACFEILVRWSSWLCLWLVSCRPRYLRFL